MDVVQDTAQKLLANIMPLPFLTQPNWQICQPGINRINIREPVNLVAHNLGMLDSTSGGKNGTMKQKVM